jgi:cytochrome c553
VRSRLPSARGLAIWAGITIVILAVAALLFAGSGLYSVAASRGHFAVTTWFLDFALRRSVVLHSRFIEVPPLDDADMVRLGAAHFETGCAPCHGSPLTRSNPIPRSMLPPPPPLDRAARDWSAEQLFWIVKNGLKYTGMPAWPAQRRGDEVWPVVAFLSRLPDLSPAEYRGLALAGASAPARRAIAGLRTDLADCARCHGDQGSPPPSRLVPKLSGQSAAYLAAALRHYADGTRPSGVMQAVAAALDTGEITRISEHYATQADGGIDADHPAEQVEHGRRIAVEGLARQGVPPCIACHGARSNPMFPRLAGQHARYIVSQLQLWQRGGRDLTVLGAVMAPIARRLDAGQIEAVAAYFASLPATRADAGDPAPERRP